MFYPFIFGYCSLTVVPQPAVVRPFEELPSQMQVLLPSKIEEHARQLLVLEYSFLSLLERLAVRCDRPCTVQALFRKAKFDMCGNTFRCLVTYRHGMCQATFYDDQEVKVPFASLVQLEVLKVPSFPCESFQIPTPEQIAGSRIAHVVEASSSARHERLAQQAQHVLSHQPSEATSNIDDVVDFMQRSLSSPPVTLSTRSAECSSLSGSNQVPLALRSPHQATMYYASMAHLWEYWNGCPWYSTQDYLYVLCAMHYSGGTSSSAQYCPIDYIRPHRTDHNFATWCREVAPMMWQVGASVFPVHGDVYTNVPTLLFVEEAAGMDVPFLVQVIGRGQDVLLTYVANQTMRVMDILCWVHRDYPLTGDVSFESMEGRLRQNILVQIRQGSFFRVLLHPEREGLPDGGTSYTSESAGASTLDSWGSYSLPPVEMHPILYLPLPLSVIVDAAGNLYGAQPPGNEPLRTTSDTVSSNVADEMSLMYTGQPLQQERPSSRRLDFRHLAPQDVWRWPIPWPPGSSYSFSSTDTVRHQLMTLWTVHHGDRYDFRIWTLPRGTSPAAHGVLLSLCLKDDWGQRFADLSGRYGISTPFLLISIAQQPEGDANYHLLMMERQLFYEPIRFFMLENTLLSPASREIVACPEVCMYEHVLQNVQDRGCSATQQCELIGHTPRGPERLLQGQTINLPTGTLLRLRPHQEDRLCNVEEVRAFNLPFPDQDDSEALFFMQAGAALHPKGPDATVHLSLQERDVSSFLEELRSGCSDDRGEGRCALHLVSGSEDIVREQVANVHIQDLANPRAFVYCLLRFLPLAYAGSFRIWMFRTPLVEGMHSLLAVHRDRPGQVPVYVRADFASEPMRKHIAFMHQPQPAVYFVGCFGWERMLQARADRYSFQVDDVPTSSLSTVDMKPATFIHIRETAYCEFERGLPVRQAYWDNPEDDEEGIDPDALTLLQRHVSQEHANRIKGHSSLVSMHRSTVSSDKSPEEGIWDHCLATIIVNLTEGTASVQIDHSRPIALDLHQFGRSPKGVRRPWLKGTGHPQLTWHRDPYECLRPPGNPVWWLSHKLQCLDDYFCVNSHEIVVDGPQCEGVRMIPSGPHLQNSQPESPIQISLWKYLNVPSSPAATVPGEEAQQVGVELPNLAPLLDELLSKRPTKQHDWNEIRSILSPAFRDEYDQLGFGWPDRYQEVILYTDGSNTREADKTAAWAFVVFVRNADQHYIVDLDYGLVETDPMSEGWTGATKADARSAEADALIKAIEWCLSFGLEMRHTLRYDSTSVGQPAAGQARIAEHDKQLRILRAIARAWDAYLGKGADCIWQHVRGHTGCLGNELADSLAKFAYQQQATFLAGHRPDYLAYVFGKRFPIEMLWLYFEQSGAQSLFPDIVGCRLALPKLRQERDIAKKLPASLLQEPPKSQTNQTFRLFAATFNVATLGQRQGTFFVQYLKEQMSAHHLDVLFLQESRSRSSQFVCSSTHIRVTCASNKGHGGVEIWIASKEPKTHKPVAEKQHVRVMHADAELLVVCAKIRGIELLLVTGHAPHSGHPPEKIQVFWQQVMQLLKPHYDRRLPILCGFDANAHFGEATAPYVGDFGLEKRTDHGATCFLEVLRRFQLFLPSTFENHHTGDHTTWRSHATGAGARCDYFAVPLAWQHAYVHTQVLHTLDTSLAGADHSPLSLDCKIVLTRTKVVRHSNTFDRDALLKAEPEQVERVLSNIQVPSWHEDPDVHAMQLADQVCARLQTAFPIQKSKPRSSYISDETWNIRTTRMRLRDKIRTLKDQLQHLSMRTALRAWRYERRIHVSTGEAFSLLHDIVRRQRQIADTTKQLTKRLKADRVIALEALASKAYHLAPRDFMRALRAVGVGGRKKMSAIQPLPLLRGRDGHVLETEDEHKTCWREYFAAQEDGKITTFEQLFHEAAISRSPTCHATWENLPTAYQVEQKFRDTARGKAYFADGIPGELLALAPKKMTDLYYTLMCKQVIYLHEPLLFKGGYLTPVYKKGDASQPENYRSLFVSSVIGKTVHSIYRNDLLDIFEASRLPFQIGGLRGQSILQAAHALQSFHRGAVKENRAVGLLFIDVTNAFYRLVRQHLVTPQADRRGAAELFRTLGLPPDTFQEFQSLLAQEPALDAARTPPFLRDLFKEFYAHTWFQVKSDSIVVESQRGSRPGDSFADLCFSFTLTQLLKPILDFAREKYPGIEISWDGRACPYRTSQEHHPLGPLVPIWADDIAFAFTAPTSDELLCLIKEISGELFDGLLKAGLIPNFNAGKTELLLDLRGPKSLTLRREMCHNEQQICIPSQFQDYQLRLVGCYKHLGTWIQIGSGISMDIKTKFAIAHDLVTRYKGPVFSNRALAFEKKRQLFETMVLSTITFNAAAWMPRNCRQQQQLHSSFMKLYKRVCILHFGGDALTWSDDKVLNQFRLPSPEVTLRQARLRYVLQLCKGGQPHMWGLLQADGEWYQRFCKDVTWLDSFCPEAGLQGLQMRWDLVVDYVTSSPTRWKRLIKTAVHRHISCREIDMQWLEWQTEIMHEVLEAGFALPKATNACKQYYCLACKKSFKRQSDLSVHSFKKHHRLKPARQYVSGNTCEACLKTYPLHSDLINHVSRALRCLQFYQDRGLEVQPEPGVNSRTENRQRKALREPFMQAEGPVCPDPDCMMIQVNQACEKLKQEWDRVSISRPHPETWLEQLRLATLSTTLHHAEIIACFQEWTANWCLQHQDLKLAELKVFAHYTSKASLEWFLSGDCQTEAVAENANQFFQRVAWAFHDLTGQISRTVRYNPRVVAHLFSGERRPEDLQEHLERAGFKAISVDIIFDTHYGNLLRPETMQLFVRALRSGVLAGFLAGPPCETWSRARFVALADGPRPVRSVERPQGLQNLNKREAQQVSTGNQLLAVALKLFWIAILSGSVAIIEHPAMPEGNLPSIWRLPVIQFFLKFTTVFKIRVEQGRYGGLSPKPTDLLLANPCQDFRRLFLEGRTTPLPTTSRIGRGEDGSWKTSILKQYPSGFCSVLAALFHEAIPMNDTGEQLPDWFSETTANLVAHFNTEAPMGPDFCAAALSVNPH